MFMSEEEYTNKNNALEQEIKIHRKRLCEVRLKLTALETEQEELRNRYQLSSTIKRKDSCVEEYVKEFEWSQDVQRLLRETFKFENFRLKQLAAINGTLSKKDVILVMPTGGGKSLVYQLPALLGNLTLVISPLISLIDDQLKALQKLGIKAATLNSSTSKEERNAISATIADPDCDLKLLYITPEWLSKCKLFINHIQKCDDQGLLDRIVIDEIHCCSEWGHDFRPDYNTLSRFKVRFPHIPILGLTATATMATLVDIQEQLLLKDCLIITAPFNRPNLYYKVIHKPGDKEDCLNYLVRLISHRFPNQSGLIYTTTTTECDDLVKGLRARGMEARAYYATLDEAVKKKVHAYWLENKIHIIVATIAFGMGIDKPDVRFVIHNCVPKSLEGYYQESGRAGRNGERADCILMFNLTDHLRNVAMTCTSRELATTAPILKYCIELQRCRRQLIAEHFDDSWRQTDCDNMCDNCHKPKNLEKYDVTSYLTDILKIMNAARGKMVKLTLNKLMLAWTNKGEKKLRVPTVKAPTCSKQECEHIVAYFLLHDYLRVNSVSTMYAAVPYLEKNSEPPDQPIIIQHLAGLKLPSIKAKKDQSGESLGETSESVPKKKKKN